MKLAAAITGLIDRFYFAPIAKFVPRRTFRYAACGGFNTFVLDPLLFSAIYHGIVRDRFINLCWVVVSPHTASLILEFPIINFTGFWLNKYVAFRGSPVHTAAQVVRYCMSIGTALLINYLCMKLFVEALHIYPTPSKILSNVITAVSSYLFQRYYTFRGATE